MDTSASSSAAADVAPSNTASTNVMVYHMDDSPDDSGMNVVQHMIAGATAGLSEHVFMYPVDVVKTRMQTMPAREAYRGIFSALGTMARVEGAKQLFRGINAVVIAAVPSHAFYFATYEFVKHVLTPPSVDLQQSSSKDSRVMRPSPIVTGVAGVAATAVHDAISTPLDVIKQRMQVQGSTYRGVWDCAKSVLSKEGPRSFFVSYPTTLIMNVPFAAVYFASYETLKFLLNEWDGTNARKALKREQKRLRKLQEQQQQLTSSDPSVSSIAHSSAPKEKEKHRSAPWKHMIAGGGAGAFAAAISTPLDVIKTRLQVQGEVIETGHNCGTCSTTASVDSATQGTRAYLRGFRDAAKTIYHEDGYRGFIRGWRARMVFFAPSAAICWCAYELMKEVLGV